jgi:hypothetical protein
MRMKAGRRSIYVAAILALLFGGMSQASADTLQLEEPPGRLARYEPDPGMSNIHSGGAADYSDHSRRRRKDCRCQPHPGRSANRDVAQHRQRLGSEAGRRDNRGCRCFTLHIRRQTALQREAFERCRAANDGTCGHS